jgi:hypothetical protein
VRCFLIALHPEDSGRYERRALHDNGTVVATVARITDPSNNRLTQHRTDRVRRGPPDREPTRRSAAEKLDASPFAAPNVSFT